MYLTQILEKNAGKHCSVVMELLEKTFLSDERHRHTRAVISDRTLEILPGSSNHILFVLQFYFKVKSSPYDNIK